MQVSDRLVNDFRFPFPEKTSANELFLGLPETLWVKIIRTVNEKTTVALTLTSKRFRLLTQTPPESLETLFGITASVQLNIPRPFKTPFSTKVENSVVIRHGKNELHLYDTRSGTSAYIHLYRDSIKDIYYSGVNKNVSVVGFEKNYAVNFTDNGCQAFEISPEMTPKRPSSPLGIAKIQKCKQINIKGNFTAAILMDCLFFKPSPDSTFDVMDLYTQISNAIFPKAPSIVKSFQIFKGKTITCRQDGLIEIFDAKTGEKHKEFGLEQSKSLIVEIVLHGRFLAVLREHSKCIDIVDVITEKLLHTFTAKSEIESLFFENNQLVATLKNGSVEIWGNNIKKPSGLIQFKLNSPSQTNKKKQHVVKRTKFQEQQDYENDQRWLSGFMEASSVSN